MTTLTIEIPDSLMSRLELAGQPVQDVVLKALQQYVESESSFAITQTQTWQLCGALEVSAEAQFVVGQDKQGKAITNYAEHVDEVLY